MHDKPMEELYFQDTNTFHGHLQTRSDIHSTGGQLHTQDNPYIIPKDPSSSTTHKDFKILKDIPHAINQRKYSPTRLNENETHIFNG